MPAVDAIDETHDPTHRSFVESANDPDTDFPIQNLPLGIFTTPIDPTPRIGIAIGDFIFDLRRANGLALLAVSFPREVLEQKTLNPLFAQGRPALRELRRCLADILDHRASGNAAWRHSRDLLAPIDQCTVHHPVQVTNYTDFYAGIYHARAAGALLTPENPLPQNYKWMPIGYQGRASSVQIGRGVIGRPLGQRPPAVPGAAPGFGPSERLDFELEMGFYIADGNRPGHPIPISESSQRIAGFSLLNDWSARDIQRWEMFPLGPFQSKSFATSVSPWVVTCEALAPFRVAAMARPEGDPQPLAYLADDADQAAGGIDVDLEVYLSTEQMRRESRPAFRVLTSNARYLYWTPAQMIAHHTANGCNLETGDLFGTGTISGPKREELSSMLELTAAGSRPVTLPNGERREFLEDGDEVVFKGRCSNEGFVSIGFGSCTGRIAAANTLTAQSPAS